MKANFLMTGFTNEFLVYIYTLDKRGKDKYINGESLVESLWSSGKEKDLEYHHISGSIHMSCKTKSHFSGHLI